MNWVPFLLLALVMQSVGCKASKNGNSSIVLRNRFLFPPLMQRAKILPSSNLCL